MRFFHFLFRFILLIVIELIFVYFQCKPGQVGELLGKIRGSPFSEFSGYHGNEEGTTKKMIRDVFEKGDQFYRTGDLLKRDERGFFYFVDRIGDNYRWKGENISTSEVIFILFYFIYFCRRKDRKDYNTKINTLNFKFNF